MIKTVNHFMKTNFPNLTLQPPLFYFAQHGLRFEISLPCSEHDDPNNVRQMYERSNTIFNHIFQETDHILLVSDVHCEKDNPYLQKHPLNVYLKYIKCKNIRKKLTHTVLPCLTWDEDDEDFADMVTHRFALPCMKRDIHYRKLLAAITYEDFSHPTTILKRFVQSSYDIYFINVTKNMIFHLYDDRGCDVIAASKEDLRPLYENLNSWILDYDREQINRLFV